MEIDATPAGNPAGGHDGLASLLYLLDELERFAFYSQRGDELRAHLVRARGFLAERAPAPPLVADSTPAPVFRPPAVDELPQHRGEGATERWPYGRCFDAACWCSDARAAVDQLLLQIRARDARRSDTPPPYDA